MGKISIVGLGPGDYSLRKASNCRSIKTTNRLYEFRLFL